MSISVERVVTVDRSETLAVFCCGSFEEALTLARAHFLYNDMPIEQRAERMGIGITAHELVIARAMAAVDVVNSTIAQMQSAGGMQSINSAFKARRKVEPSLRYHDWLHRHKERMLQAMAKEIGK